MSSQLGDAFGDASGGFRKRGLFVGPQWHPHVTVASVRKEDWPAVERDLWPTPPAGACTFPVLHEYDLIDNKPVEVGEIHLAAAA